MRVATIVILGGWLAPLGAGAVVTTADCYADSIVAAGPPLDFVSSLAIRASDGKVFAADNDGQGEIYRLDDAGPRKVADATTPGFLAGGESSLSAIVFGPDGTLHAALADGRVYRFAVLADDPIDSAADLVVAFPSGWLTDIAFDGPSTLYGAEFATGSGDSLFRATAAENGWQVDAIASADGISGLHVDEQGTVYLSEWATGTLFRLDTTGLAPIASAGAAFNFQLALDGKFVPHPSDPTAWLITVGRDTAVREARGNEASILAAGYADSATWPGTDTFPSDITRGSGSEVFVADGIGIHRLAFTCGGAPDDDDRSLPHGAAVDPFFPRDREEDGPGAAGCAIARAGWPDRGARTWAATASIFAVALIFRRRVAG